MKEQVTAILILFVLTIALLFVGKTYAIKGLSKAVVEELKRSYTPGPYHPGFDPDKVDPKAFQQNTQLNIAPPQQTQRFQDLPPPVTAPYVDQPQNWNQIWESQRF